MFCFITVIYICVENVLQSIHVGVQKNPAVSRKFFQVGINLISDGSRSEESEMYFFPVLVTTVLVTA